MKGLILAALMLCASSAWAEEQYVKIYAGFNAVSFDGSVTKPPSDYEAGASARASLSPHLSLTGSAWKGLARDYSRATFGARLTATDVNEPDFNVFLGGDYQASSNKALRPQEWQAGAGFGWRPWKTHKKVVVGAEADYGISSKIVSALAALRYELGGI